MGNNPTLEFVMATQQIFLTLCIVGVTVCLPRGLLTDVQTRSLPSSSDHQEVVSNVISALGPSISEAVALALADLNTNINTDIAETTATATRFEEQRPQPQILILQQEEQRSQQSASAENSGFNLEPASFEREISNDLSDNEDAVYKFQYKVADGAQSYISKEEERDGNELTGTYSFVDATGALVTVNYRAGLDGYSEERTMEPDFVEMRPIPVWTGELAGVSTNTESGTTASSSSRESSSSIGSRFSSSRTGSVFTTGSSSSSSSSSGNQEDLVASIIAALSPQITSAVNAAIA